MTYVYFQKLMKLIVLLVALPLLTSACLSSAYTFKGTALDPPMTLPEVTLKTTAGQPFRLDESDGKISLVYFGYTFCPDVCPLTMGDVKSALSELGPEREQVRVVFVSVDPERDTPEVLSHYLAAFDPTYIGLTDEPARIDQATAAFGVFAEKETADSAAGYLVSHTSRLFLVDQRGEIALLYSFGFAPEDLRSDLTHLLQGG